MKSFAKILSTILPLICFLAIWQIISLAGILNQNFLPSPLAIVAELIRLLRNDSLAADIIASVKRILTGFILASIIGIMLGTICGMNKKIYGFLNPLIEVFRPIPPIAWIPLAILWLGLGDQPAFFLVLIGAFFPIFTNTYSGIISLDKIYQRAAYSLGATKIRIITDVIWPAALPNIFTGLKIGLGISWMSVIVAEMVGAQSGLGYMIQLNRITLNITGVIVGMIVISTIGFLMNKAVIGLEKYSLPWK
jgi:NitT/TauT family transport system permease protein